MKRDSCQKYGIAITDYILGEEMDMPKDELFNHVAKCKDCQKDLVNWRENYAILRNEAYFKRPEAQKKYQNMLESIKKGSACIPPDLSKNEKLKDTNWEIGHYAGEVHKFLGKTGKITIDDIAKKTEFDKALLNRIIGWLAREDKICITEINKTEYVYLKPHEMKIYNNHRQQTST